MEAHKMTLGLPNEGEKMHEWEEGLGGSSSPNLHWIEGKLKVNLIQTVKDCKVGELNLSWMYGIEFSRFLFSKFLK